MMTLGASIAPRFDRSENSGGGASRGQKPGPPADFLLAKARAPGVECGRPGMLVVLGVAL
jgi:hypothetical protein